MNHILYKLSKNGQKTQYWEIEVSGDKYRTIEGYVGGALTTSEWTYAEGKNIGKANETSPDQQAELEVASKVQKKRDKGYGDSMEEAARPFGVTLAKKWEDYKEKVEYPVFVGPKLDGLRAYLKDGSLFYRSNKPVLSCEHLNIDSDYVLDGELYNHELKDDFNKIVSLIRKDESTPEAAEKVQYHIFDIISDKPFAARLDIIDAIVENNPNYVAVEWRAARDESEVDFLLDLYLKQGYEGAMIRWGNDGYIQERTNKLLKYKIFVQDAEFEILEIQDGRGKRSGTCAKWVLKTKEGKTFEANTTGTDEENLERWNRRHEFRGKMATIKYQSLTPDGIPRFGTFKSVREDI